MVFTQAGVVLHIQGVEAGVAIHRSGSNQRIVQTHAMGFAVLTANQASGLSDVPVEVNDFQGVQQILQCLAFHAIPNTGIQLGHADAADGHIIR